MKTIVTFSLALVVAAAALITGCSKDADMPAGARVPVLPGEVYSYDQLPEGAGQFFTSPFGQQSVDNQKATLGRVLFYETQLSVNNTRSCGSCHIQQKAFSDGSQFSAGFNNHFTTRNSPSIVNPGTQFSYFWDMRESDLTAMVTQPIANHVEMGLEEPEYMAAKVGNLPYYEELFTNAFGDASVTSARIGEALSHFVRSVITVSSKFDQAQANGFTSFNALELRGKELFFNELPCASCHGGEHFNGWGGTAHNIGLELDYVDDGVDGTDWMTGQKMDGWFKAPSLRNVALTAPYMHDGRFATLEEVVNFYNSGIQDHPQLDFSLREGWNGGGFEEPPFGGGNAGAPLRMNLSTYDQAALVAFLRTLSDETLISDKKFSDPFVMQQ